MNRGSRVLISMLLSFCPGVAFATFSEFFGTRKLCEHYLTGGPAKTAALDLNRQIFERPFTFSALYDVKPAALKALKLDNIKQTDFDKLVMSFSRQEKGLDPLIFRLQLFTNGKLDDLHSHGFPDDSVVFWSVLSLDSNEARLPFQELKTRHPIPEAPSIRDGFLGFHTDPDRNGFRVYISTREYLGSVGTAHLEFGLDVPCARVDEFVDPMSGTAQTLLTNATEYCRVPVLSFQRQTFSGDGD